MKRKNMILGLLLTFTISLSLFIISCDIKDPVEGFEVRVKNIPRTTTARVELLDAKTGQQIGALSSHKVTIKFEGANKNDVITTVNESITSIETNVGVAEFAIRDDIIPTIDDPVELLLLCSSNNYISTSEKIQIYGPDANTFSVIMTSTEEGQQPDGVSSNTEESGQTDSDQGTGSNIVVSASEEEDPLEPTATIEIPEGTILRNADGLALSGNVIISVTYFNPLEEESQAAFPGGFNVATETEGDVSFTTAGFVAIDIMVDDEEVENLDIAQIQIDVPENVINPETGTEVQPGDKIPLWSYDEDNAIWNYEGEYEVQLTSRGKLSITIKDVKHLSYYNLDWFEGNICDWWNATKIFIDKGQYCGSSLYFKLLKAWNDQYLKGGPVPWDNLIIPFGFPSDQSIKLKIFSDPSYSNLLVEETFDNLCGGGNTVAVSVDCPEPPVPCIDVDVTVVAVCPNGNTLAEGTLNVDIFKDGYWQFAGRLVDGEITIPCLVVGESYNFRVFYDGEYHTEEYTVTGPVEFVEVEIGSDIDLCQ